MSDLRYKNKLFDVICFGVGQGLFTLVTYTDKNNKKSGFVFDCGGDKMYIEGDTSYWYQSQITSGAISRFIKFVNDNNITIKHIFISHMHSDHINGISKLVVMLTKLKKHDFKIILPNFVKKVEISEAVALAYLVQNNVKLDDFVYNPIVYAFSLQNISEEQTKQLSQAYENKEKNKIKNSIVDAQYEINDLKNQLQVLNISDKDKKKISKKIGKYETKLSSLLFQQKRAEEKWKNIRSMKEYVLKNIQEMKDDYDEIPNMKVFKITNALTQKASKEIEEALGDVEIKKFFHLEDGIDTIKKIYKENKVDGNNYSMYIKYKLNSRYTLLLSGDALLNKEKSASLRIGKEKIIFQISHHGSFPSNDFFINKYGKNIKYAFVSFGFQNTYRHPDFRTIEIIGNKKIKFVTCFKDDNAYNDKINEIVLKD